MATKNASEALIIPESKSPDIVSLIALVIANPGTKSIIEPIIVWFIWLDIPNLKKIIASKAVIPPQMLFMKKVLILLTTIMIVALTGCKYVGYKNISYEELTTKLNNNESFVFVIGSRDCRACTTYKGTMEEIMKDYDVSIYFIEIADLNEEDGNKLRSQFYYQYTPTTIFIEDGKEKTTYDRIVGAADYETVKNALIKYNMIKEK